MKGIEAIRKQLSEIATGANAGAIPTTDANGNRTWIRGHGSGLRFLREITKWQRDGGKLSADLYGQVQLWSQAEVDGSNFGEISRMNRTAARKVLGLDQV